MRLLFLSSLFFPSLLIADVASFAPFQTILEKHLVERTTSKGFESFFNYQPAFENASVKKLMLDQKIILASFHPANLKTKQEALAFWINTYNFFMISKIFQGGFKNGRLKINSVHDMGGWFTKYAPFSEKDFNVGGEKMHLDDFEKGWLLGAEGDFKGRYQGKGWKDARIHFAVNCASVGCPPLRKKIYVADSVDKVLDENARLAFQTHRHLHFKGKTLRVTKLFDWYSADFKQHSGSVQKFIAQFVSDETLKNRILAVGDGDIEFIDYDWKLNKKENF